MAREQRMVPVIGTANLDTDEEGAVRFTITPSGRDALEEDTFARPLGATPLDECAACLADPELCPEHGVNSEGAREVAVLGNFDTVARQQRTIRELEQRLEDVKATHNDYVVAVGNWRHASDALKTENDTLIAAHAELLADKVLVDMRLARLTEYGVPAPVSLDEAITQLFDAEAVYAGAEQTALLARGQKFEAQSIRDHGEAAAIVRLVGEGGKRGEIPRPGAMSPTEAKDRLMEDSEYSILAYRYRDAARESDALETALRTAASRVETLRECVHAMSNRSPLTSRAAAIARTQQ